MEIRLTKANKKKRRNKHRGPRYWVLAMGTMGMLVAFTVGSSRAMNVGYAVERNGRFEITRNFEDDALTPYVFNIPAGPLGDVLEAFKKVTGIDFKVDKPEIMDLGSAGVTGTFTAEQALQKILEGTGIGYSFTDPRNVSIVLRAQGAVVNVTDSGERVISSLKQTAALRDIPQSISVISKDTIEKQGATTLRDVLNNVPGITITAGEGGAPAGDNLTIRGFSARNDIYVDGVRSRPAIAGPV